MNIQLKRKMIISAIGVIIAAAVIYGFLPGTVPVDVAQVKRGPMQVTIEEQGKTQVKDRFVITAPVTGYMRRIDVKVADSVEKGSQVAFLEPLRSQDLDARSSDEANKAVAAAQALLNAAQEGEGAARAGAEYAASRLVRFKGLYERGAIAKDAYEQAQTEAVRTGAVHRSAVSEVEAARSALDKARIMLKSYADHTAGVALHILAVYSPVKGQVLRIYRQSEGAVNMGDPIMDVGHPGSLEVRVEVLSSDAVKIRKGTPVSFERWGGETPLAGKVRVVEPAAFTKVSSLGVEEQRVVVLVDITTPAENWQRLGDGYRLEASFIVWEGPDVLQVPAGAVFRSGKGWAVFVADKGKARQRAIGIGHRTGTTAQIVSGLKEGEMVITHPDDAVTEGARVEPR